MKRTEYKDDDVIKNTQFHMHSCIHAIQYTLKLCKEAANRLTELLHECMNERMKERKWNESYTPHMVFRIFFVSHMLTKTPVIIPPQSSARAQKTTMFQSKFNTRYIYIIFFLFASLSLSSEQNRNCMTATACQMVVSFEILDRIKNTKNFCNWQWNIAKYLRLLARTYRQRRRRRR